MRAPVRRVDLEPLELDDEPFVPWQRTSRLDAIGRKVTHIGHLDLHASHTRAERRHTRRVHDDSWSHRGHACEERALSSTDLGEPIARRVPKAKTRVEPADLDLTELRMLELTPRSQDSPAVVIAVPARQLHEVLAVELGVAVDEALSSRQPGLLEEVPELADPRESPSLVVRKIAEVPVKWPLGLVEKLVKSTDGGVTGKLVRPRLQLTVERQIAGIHLRIRRGA